ncbi:hypothetical protein SKAU_G00196480 [Synaphobranchus kaupii]|uniref:G-patch domain-containing protein n=1 Tax=Synaphobranchus kaupii TaxID=118154 RepID=A0A9Q1FEP0_SYNKA|nr:hypothetical protein SKAU_G00196480 [Synaphobranchus kaupii]
MNGLIKFTAAKEANGCWPGNNRGSNQQERQSIISGEEAKHFYQSLIEEGGAGRGSRRDKRRKTTGSERESRSGREQPRLSGREQPRRSGREQPRLSGREQPRLSGREQPRLSGREQPPRSRREQTRLTTAASVRDGHKLLKCAQEGDLPGLGELLEKGCDINFQDDYYWTAIMCASYAGQRGAVRLLLQKGAAWIGVVDIQGRDARDLADQAGHMEVVGELDGYGVRPDTPGTSSVSASQPQWCSVCGTQYSESEDRHQSSTLHQFSLRRPPPTPQYCLPASNAGYRMMVREGWDPREGLGPEGSGRKNPIRTVLKRDLGGLGYGPSPQARVTHFKAKDTQAVKLAHKGRMERKTTQGRRAERRQEVMDKNWERDFRTSFNL